MSLRALLATFIVAITLFVAGLAAVVLVEATKVRGELGTTSNTIQSVRAAEELEIALLILGRERFLADVTGSEQDRLHADQAAVQLDRWLAAAALHVTSPEERHQMDRVREGLERYEARWKEAGRRGLGAVETRQFVAGEMDEALEAIAGLVVFNLSQAEHAAAAIEASTQRSRTTALTLMAVAAVVMLTAWRGLRRWLYEPAFSVRAAMARFARGETGARATLAGPTDFREIAATFNEMADTIAAQRDARHRFVAQVAHDLRNPLNALSLTAASVRPDLPLPPEDRLRQRFALVERQAAAIARMLQDLQDVAAIEAGRLDMHRRTCDLRDLVRDAGDLHEHTSAHHRIVTDLPEEAVWVDADPLRLSQVMVNLVSNAVKYSPAGGEVRIALSAAGGEARIAVIDSGVGVAPEEIPRIFEPFRRGEGVRDSLPGAGLGLSASRRIVAAHGGRIEVESTPGRGSVFTVVLPLAHRPGAGPGGQRRREPGGGGGATAPDRSPVDGAIRAR